MNAQKTGLFFGLFCLAALMSCQNRETGESWKEKTQDPSYFHENMALMTEVIIHDIFSPPVASRIYAYVSIAGYEALRPGYPGYSSLGGQLNGLNAVPQPAEGREICFPLASAEAMLITGKTLLFSTDSVALFREQMLDRFREMGVPEEVFTNSLNYGQTVAAHILAWSNGDHYKESRSFPKYTLTEQPDKWRPTPPDYGEALEPHWNTIRPMALDSAQQFKADPPTPFSTDKNSRFYQEAMEVYQAFETDTLNRAQIANFWDCNPYASYHSGHIVTSSKKITPGGHWIGIAGIASKTAGLNAVQTAEAYTRVAISLFDAFIACWDEKYRSEVVRPETYINIHIDPAWRPRLQTPPFPEYTSGHSVISRAAAVALSGLFGPNFTYVDTVEERFGLPARKFNSFYEASDEASLSRLYGGIHYMPAIANGVRQGQAVGEWIAANVQTREQVE